ncbi:HNH endonuclease, partial [Clostridium sp.]
IREVLINVEQSDVCIFNPNGNVNGDAKGARYTMERINEMILAAIGDNVDNRERIFSKEIKTSLFQKQNAICGICNQKMLTIEDTEIDHIKPFSEGGTTEIDNAQLTHIYCNRSKGNKVS